ncbi:hypothetical protein [Pasteurella testudinis]|uniref:hypothetical protein n=1 Tax=Pasteurella testudinis TaxID=761 RepID=UPI0040599BCF
MTQWDLKTEIYQVQQNNPHYGYRHVTLKLGSVNHKWGQRLIKEMGLQIMGKKKRKYCAYQGELAHLGIDLFSDGIMIHDLGGM